MSDSIARTSLYTALALIAFAANSVLCRLALIDQNIDPYSFTAIRLFSGALILLFIVTLRGDGAALLREPNYIASLVLFVYAIAFSMAYTMLDTATGAVILFASTQIALLLFSVFNREPMLAMEWLGLLIALAGFVYLLLPDWHRPSIFGFILMAIAGFAWGVYTYVGRRSTSVLLDTSKNFIGAMLLIAILFLYMFYDARTNMYMNTYGVVLAVVSGSIASGIGYVLWYAALRKLSSIQAATVPTLVPVIAAFGGVVLVSEEITAHLLLSSVIILSGILVLISGRYY